jgi:hypothetical protein
MFSTLRTRFGIPGVISVMALVFAMLGGAYAANNSSGGGKATASAKAKKGPRGPKGATGPAGPQGPAGATGDAGANGAAGGVGPAGPAGPEGKQGKEGPEGKAGKDGATGFTETLPAGESETGTWTFRTELTEEISVAQVPISFPIPTAHKGRAYFFTSTQVAGGQFGENETTHEKCEVGELECVDTGCRWALGDAEVKPESTSNGTLCVFLERGSPAVSTKIEETAIYPPGEPATLTEHGPAGAYLYVTKKASPNPGTPTVLFGVGAWAVRGN